MNNVLQLPTSWQIKTLGEVCEITMGQSPLGEKVINKKQNTNSKALEFHQGKICFTDKFITESEVVTTDIRKVAQSNSILLCVRAPVGVINITQRQIAIGRGLCALNFKDKNSNNDFLYFYLLTLKNYFNEKATGSTFSAINLDTIKNTKIPLPPLEIQKRIVARLESAFEKIEKGSAHLQDAKTKLAKYKQSLLKSAFNGTLFCHTEGEARSISNQESRDISLTLNMTNSPSLRASVASVAIHESKVDCHDLTSSNLAMTDKENPKLPQGWTIKTLGEIAFVTKLAGFEYTKYIYPNLSDFGIPLFKGKNIQGNKLILKFESYIPKEISNQLERSKLNKKCILTPYVGSIGNVAIFDGSFEAHLGSNVGKIEILNNNALEEYICYFLQSGIGYLELTKHKKATAQESISIAAIRDVKIPLPPLEIQKQIVKLLEKHLQHADKAGKFIESALNKAKQLKQSLLKSAFLGKLT